MQKKIASTDFETSTNQQVTPSQQQPTICQIKEGTEKICLQTSFHDPWRWQMAHFERQWPWYPVGCWTSLIRYGMGRNQWTPPPTCCCDAASFGCRTGWRRRVCQRICTGNAVECGTRPRQEIAFFELGSMCCSDLFSGCSAWFFHPPNVYIVIANIVGRGKKCIKSKFITLIAMHNRSLKQT